MVLKKPLNFGQKTITEKMAELNNVSQNDTEEKIIEEKKEKSDKIDQIISSKADAMRKYDLKPKTKGVKALLTNDDHIKFRVVAAKLGKTIEEMASEYVLEGLKRDIKKIDFNL